MYDIKWIRENPDVFDRGLTRRGLTPLSGKLIALDEARRAAITKSEQAQARRNAASKEIGAAKAKKDEATAQRLMAEVAELKTTMPALDEEQKKLGAELDKELAQIPNMPLDDVPDGKDEHGNVERHVWGKKRDYAFTPKQHFELGEALGMMDFELAAKLSGARFVVLQKGLARLERALGQFMLDLHTGEHGYTEVNPPLMVRPQSMFGTAQLPKFRDDQFQATTDDVRRDEIRTAMDVTIKAYAAYGREKATEAMAFPIDFETRNATSVDLAVKPGFLWLIPTAEVPLTNLVRESILDEASLPLRYTACTPCFRAEAGAAGKDTRGMIRQHQFTKCELVSIVTPEKSREEHERMLACAEEVLKKLDLHYRVITLCTGDMGFASQKTYDIEVWLPGQNDGKGAYREISSCSVCGEFQARRMNARYRPSKSEGLFNAPFGTGGFAEASKPRFVHTLNGSGVAVGRALIAVMETYQDDKGAIVVPDALVPYMGGVKKIEKAV
jgi:seryl-tRNA synthetase